MATKLRPTSAGHSRTRYAGPSMAGGIIHGAAGAVPEPPRSVMQDRYPFPAARRDGTGGLRPAGRRSERPIIRIAASRRVTICSPVRMQHRDSPRQPAGEIGPGDVQWMPAGRRPSCTPRLPGARVRAAPAAGCTGFQLWVTLAGPRQDVDRQRLSSGFCSAGAITGRHATDRDGLGSPRRGRQRPRQRRAATETHLPILYAHRPCSRAPSSNRRRIEPRSHRIRRAGQAWCRAPHRPRWEAVLFAPDGIRFASRPGVTPRKPLELCSSPPSRSVNAVERYGVS
jgi:hypothetical protein